MAIQQVNTESISAASAKLRMRNSNINSEFQNLKDKAVLLESKWKGAAGTEAMTTMHKLFNYSSERSTVIQNYINMLEQQVNPGYIDTEDTNKMLADMFK